MNRIKELRSAGSVKQSDLAAAIQVSQAALSGYETEKFQADNPTKHRNMLQFFYKYQYLLETSPFRTLKGQLG